MPNSRILEIVRSFTSSQSELELVDGPHGRDRRHADHIQSLQLVLHPQARVSALQREGHVSTTPVDQTNESVANIWMIVKDIFRAPGVSRDSSTRRSQVRGLLASKLRNSEPDRQILILIPTG